MQLTGRQQREIEYHRQRAQTYAHDVLTRPLPYDAIDGHQRRWWNAHWEMYGYLRPRVAGKQVLVVGCGYGEDAIRLAKCGARVSAFDLSAESLAIARKLGAREGVQVNFSECPAEQLCFGDAAFDVIVARDILHHVDIVRTVPELERVSRPGALWVLNEIYSHSITDRIRRSRMVEGLLYPAMRRFIYQSDTPYITEDERKLSETDIRLITAPMRISMRRYFNFVVTRILPDRWTALCAIDRLALMTLGPIGTWLSGRILMAGNVKIARKRSAREQPAR